MPGIDSIMNLAFWLGITLLFLFALYDLYRNGLARVKELEERRSRGDEIDTIKFYFPQIIRGAVLVIVALLILFGRGPLARTQSVRINAPAEPKGSFTEAYKSDERDLKPQTRAQVRDDANKREIDREQADLKAKQNDNERVGESITDFRDRIINRDTPMGEAQEETR